MDKEDYIKNGITGCRLKLVLFLRSRPYDLSMTILILIYTLLMFLYFASVDAFPLRSDHTIFHIIELIILGIFCLDIILHVISLGLLYLKDYWSIFDILIITLSLIFAVLDIRISNGELDSLLKIRGIFKLFRIFVIVRKLNTLRLKKDLR